jgi:hypothetical protein
MNKSKIFVFFIHLFIVGFKPFVGGLAEIQYDKENFVIVLKILNPKHSYFDILILPYLFFKACTVNWGIKTNQ